MSESILGSFIDEIEPVVEEKPKAKPRAAAPAELPDLTGELPKKQTSRGSTGEFWLDTGHGFELGFSDGRPRNARNLPREAIELFGDYEERHLLPRWLFFCELMGDRDIPPWLLHDRLERFADESDDDYSLRTSLAPSFGLSAKWEERVEQLKGICCERCGRSLVWRTLDGKEHCATCHPRKYRDERDLFAGYFKLEGHDYGLDWW